MRTALLFLIPALAGAVIGFITNVIAIKMLFRPLKEIRLFGIRLPFTPGLLPRQRHKLADNIGAMVERELLTAEIIRGRLQREEVREGVKISLSRYTEKILGTSLADLLNPAPPSPLRDFVFSLMRGLLSSTLRDTAEDFIAAELSGGADNISRGLEAAAAAVYPQTVSRAIRLLNRNDIRQRLEEQGRVFLTQVILKLNVFQRFFISTAQYDKTLHERMPEIIDDLIARLEELLTGDETRRNILQWGRESLARFLADEKNARTCAHIFGLFISARLDKPPGDFLRDRFGGLSLGRALSMDPEKKEALDSLLRDQLLRIAGEQIAAALEAVNVRVMVADRINSLDMVRVERIILDIMAHQLKWIDLFGGILGFLIGLSQALFSWFFR
jgi:uncharacterized membrane protein YheB (UPF0754 family)